MRCAYVIAALSASALVGCGEGKPPGPPPEARSRIEGLLAQVAEDTSAVRVGEADWYTPTNLYEYINGMAPRYVEAGFVLLAHTQWRAADATGDAYVALDVYDMGSPVGAREVLDPDPSRAGEAVPAYREPGSVEMAAGRYYIKVTARRDIDGQQPLVDAIESAFRAAGAEGEAASDEPAGAQTRRAMQAQEDVP